MCWDVSRGACARGARAYPLILLAVTPLLPSCGPCVSVSLAAVNRCLHRRAPKHHSTIDGMSEITSGANEKGRRGGEGGGRDGGGGGVAGEIAMHWCRPLGGRPWGWGVVGGGGILQKFT